MSCSIRYDSVREDKRLIFTVSAERTYTYVFSSYFISYPLVQEYKSIGMLRQAYLMSASPQPDQFSVLVHGIPKLEKEGETYSEKVEAFFIEFHPLHYLSHQMVFQSSELQCLLVHFSPVSNTNGNSYEGPKHFFVAC